jgi:hypothetical protein
LGKIIIGCEIVLRLLKWVEKVRNYGKWSKILGVLEEGIFLKKNMIIRRINFKNLNKMMSLYRKEMILMLKSE